MTTVDEVVDTLLELEEGDRNWIISQLSAAQRTRLSAQLGSDAQEATEVTAPDVAAPVAVSPRSQSSQSQAQPSQSQPSPSQPLQSQPSHSSPIAVDTADADRARLAAAPAVQLSDILRREPAWIVHAVLQTQPRDRAQDVLANLPHGTRSEVARVAASHVPLTAAVTMVLVRAAASRLRGADPSIRASRFDRLVDSMRLRLSRLPRLPRLRGNA